MQALSIVGTGPAGTKVLDIDSRGIITGAGHMIDSRKPITSLLLASSVDGYIWTNTDTDAIYNITGIASMVSTVGGSSAAVVVKVCTSATAPASGVAQHSTAIDLTITAPSLVRPVITTTTPINPGDSISLDFTGTLTGLIGNISIQIRRTS